jgi:hypothetical protein
MRSQSLTCSADGSRVPAAEGVTAVDGKWQLSVATHEDLFRTITGVVPTEDPDLQELATVTARLEGYVERHKRKSSDSETVGENSSTKAPDRSVFSSLVGWLHRLMRPFLSRSGKERVDANSDQSIRPDRYDVETVYELSRFFRAALEAERSAIAARSTTSPAAATAD